jgi:molybdenum cofactor biosynthesis protein B
MVESTKDKHIKDKKIPIRIQLIMVSDSLSTANAQDRIKLDQSSKVAKEIINGYGFQVFGINYIPDEFQLVQNSISEYINQKIELIITIGGTGIAKRDVTIDAITPLLHKRLPGFGELFRSLTYKDVGTVSIMSRAIAGVCDATVIVCLPGSPNAVKLGVGIILKEIVHIINLLKKP